MPELGRSAALGAAAVRRVQRRLRDQRPGAREDIPSDRTAAAMEPSRAFASSSATLPGPTRPPPARSRRMVTRGSAGVLEALPVRLWEPEGRTSITRNGCVEHIDTTFLPILPLEPIEAAAYPAASFCVGHNRCAAATPAASQSSGMPSSLPRLKKPLRF